MRITNETYMCCSECGVEASGLDDINQVFGYKIVKEDIKPFSKCRKCRGEEPDFEEHCKKNIKNKQWATAASWGRRINISRTVFDSYLIDLGYLEHDGKVRGIRNRLVVTEKGSEHSATTNSMFGKAILWDYATYLDVIRLRLSGTIVHDTCPKCKAYLDTMPEYNHLDYSHKCRRCGRKCDYWHVKVTYDR